MTRLATFTLVAALLGTACASSAAHPGATPTPTRLKAQCSSDDQSLAEPALGWAFCVPGTWHYREKLQGTDVPKGLDATFDITEFKPGADLGKFGFMIISSDDRGTSADLADWVRTNLGASVKLQTISWANAKEAAVEVGGDRRFALTQHQVVIMELRSGAGNLDLDAAMSSRLDTWQFVY